MKNNDYDVIIIGAGIGGLVCGCYLAQANLRVLIVEQCSTPGGYCTSFSRSAYKFDAATHYIGGVKKGIFSRILTELDLRNSLKFYQIDPSDKIILPETQTLIRTNPFDTLREFCKSFPSEKIRLEEFFNFAIKEDIATIYRKINSLSLSELIEGFFANKQLNTLLSLLFLGTMGIMPNKLSAFAAIILFREFFLDPGYYPIGGMQSLPNKLVEKFEISKGELITSNKVEEIIIDKNTAVGIRLRSSKKIYSKFIVSAIDTTQTFKKLISINTKESNQADKLIPSNSVYVVYLGLGHKLPYELNEKNNVWYFPHLKDIKKFTFLGENNNKNNIPGIVLSFSSNKDCSIAESDNHTMQIFTLAHWSSQIFWSMNEKQIVTKILDLTNSFMPNIIKNITMQLTATPYTMYKFTLNKRGAAFGLASTVNQTKNRIFPQITSIKNLFLAGHWCTMGSGQGGISTVALSGKKTAEFIMNYSQT